MPFTTKHTLDPSGLDDTSVGSAGNTTSVSGYTDVQGSTWHINSGKVKSVDGSNKALANLYSTNNEALNQEMTVDYPAALDSRRDILQFRWRDLGSHSEFVQVFVNQAGGILVYDTNSSGIPQTPSTPGSLSLNGTDRFRFRIRVETSAGTTTLTIQIYNLTLAAPHLWNSGSDTRSWSWSAWTQTAGRVRFLADGASQAGYDRLELKDDNIPPTPAPGMGSITGYGATSLNVHFEATTGGTPPYTVELHRGTWPDGIYFTPDEDTLIHTWTDTDETDDYDFTDTGLTPDTVYIYKQVITDDLDQTATSGITTEATGGKTRPVDVMTPSFYQIGDSITSGGTPQSVVTMAAHLSQWLGVTVVAHASGVGGGGLDTTYVHDNLTPRQTLIDAADEMDGYNPTDFQMRIGINDTVAPATWKSKYLALIDYIRTRKAGGDFPNLARIWLLTPTFRHGAADNYVPDGEVSKQAQYRVAMREIAAEDDGSEGIRVLLGDFDIWELFSLNQSLLADGIHPTDPEGYAVLGLRDAMWWQLQMGRVPLSYALSVAVRGPLTITLTPAG